MKEEYAPETRITYQTLQNMSLFMVPSEFPVYLIREEINKFEKMNPKEIKP